VLGFNFNVEEWDAEASQREARLGQIRLQYRSRDRREARQPVHDQE
jgi:hypothetical protein